MGFLLLKVDGDNVKMKKRRRRGRKPNIFELKPTEKPKCVTKRN